MSACSNFSPPSGKLRTKICHPFFCIPQALKLKVLEKFFYVWNLIESKKFIDTKNAERRPDLGAVFLPSSNLISKGRAFCFDSDSL